MKTKKPTQEKEISPAEELVKMRVRLASISREKAFLVSEEKEIQAKLNERYGRVFTDELTQREKQYGEVTMLIGENKVTMEVKKSVTWDSDMLYNIARRIGPARATQFMTIEAHITETNYSKIPLTEPFLAEINEARTVKYSTPKFSFPTKE